MQARIGAAWAGEVARSALGNRSLGRNLRCMQAAKQSSTRPDLLGLNLE